MSKQEFKNYDVVFFSPHIDDAIFSCVGLIDNLQKQKKKIAVINIFTKACDYKKTTADIKKELKKTGFKSAKNLFLKRKKIEKEIAQKLKIDVYFLNFIDGLFRQNQNKNFLYPSYEKLFSGNINNEDEKTELENILNKFFEKSSKKTTFYAPIGNGNHVDHLIVKNIVGKLTKKHKNKLFFWDDLPYSNNIDTTIKLKTPEKILTLSSQQSKLKENICGMYKTQFPHAQKEVFSSINFYKEVFFK